MFWFTGGVREERPGDDGWDGAGEGARGNERYEPALEEKLSGLSVLIAVNPFGACVTKKREESRKQSCVLV